MSGCRRACRPIRRPGEIAAALDEAMRRMRVELVHLARRATTVGDDRIVVTVRAPRPIDPRVVRYLDRSSSFEDARVEATSARPACR